MKQAGRIAGNAALVVALLGGASPAAAQRLAGDDEPVTDAFGGALGSVAGVVLSGLSINASLRTLYDDNIRRIGDGQQRIDPITGQPVEKADFRFSPTINISNSIALGRQRLSLSGTYGRDIYAKNTRLNRNNIAAGASLALQAGSACTGSLSANFQKRQFLLSQAAILTDNTIENTSLGASVNCSRPVGIGFGLGGSYNKRDNQDITNATFDSESKGVNASLNYSLPALGQLSLGGSFRRIDYPNRPVATALPVAPALLPVASGSDGFDSYSVNLGYNRTLGSRLRLNVGVSYFSSKPDPKTVVVFDLVTGSFVLQDRRTNGGVGYNLGLSYQASPRLTANITGSRSVQQSVSVGALSTVVTNLAGDIGYTLGPSINAGIGASYDKRDYQNSFATPQTGANLPRNGDTQTRIYARVGYSPPRLFDVDFEVAHRRRKSDPSIFSSSSTTAAVTVRVRFGRV